ncbi:hypothetical protein NGM99_11005 [Mesorhizobium sp. RP14(2022)]|uniref:Uncharacterized protein n=1 Tax=Mesorhizobium liriopis TaxID=2953882 RepID=A0ABT1C652_9HYPH|nr:hypothetical protein [Mesorhizobium liriopis]MCO6050312.1 hypothetical protein [Mesorhizobium liriopis]
MISPYANEQRAYRAAIENEVERLIAILDRLHADPDLEPNGYEWDEGDMPENCDWVPFGAVA